LKESQRYVSLRGSELTLEPGRGLQMPFFYKIGLPLIKLKDRKKILALNQRCYEVLPLKKCFKRTSAKINMNETETKERQLVNS